MENVARLLARIPAPLGFGRVMLDDGREVLGFLSEAAGTEGCEDITAYGGFRAFMAAQTAKSA